MEEKQYDVQAVKSRLQEYVETEREIDTHIERLDYLEVRLVGVGAQNITDMPKAPSANLDRMGTMYAAKEELETQVREMIEEQERFKKCVEAILRHLRRADERNVIRVHYFDRCDWNNVNFILFGTKDDFVDKEQTYLRRAHRIHGDALLHMAKYIEESNDPNTAIFKEA